MNTERSAVFDPTNLSESIPRYSHAIAETFPLVENYAQTNAEQLCLWYALSQAKIIRPLLKDVDRLKEKGLLKHSGGPSDNPHKPIDYIGADIAKSLIPYFLRVFGSNARVYWTPETAQ